MTAASLVGTYDGTVSLQDQGAVRRILVVDDEPMVREVLVSYLKRDGYSVDEAADGQRALALAAGNKPDLIVLDVMLPEVDGFAVLTRIRQTSSVPVILLTARSDESDRIVGLELGADDYVVKPFSPERSSLGSVRYSGAPMLPWCRVGWSSTG